MGSPDVHGGGAPRRWCPTNTSPERALPSMKSLKKLLLEKGWPSRLGSWHTSCETLVLMTRGRWCIMATHSIFDTVVEVSWKALGTRLESRNGGWSRVENACKTSTTPPRVPAQAVVAATAAPALHSDSRQKWRIFVHSSAFERCFVVVIFETPQIAYDPQLVEEAQGSGCGALPSSCFSSLCYA